MPGLRAAVLGLLLLAAPVSAQLGAPVQVGASWWEERDGSAGRLVDATPDGAILVSFGAASPGALVVDARDARTGSMLWMRSFEGVIDDLDVRSSAGLEMDPAGSTVAIAALAPTRDRHLIAALDTATGEPRWIWHISAAGGKMVRPAIAWAPDGSYLVDAGVELHPDASVARVMRLDPSTGLIAQHFGLLGYREHSYLDPPQILLSEDGSKAFVGVTAPTAQSPPMSVPWVFAHDWTTQQRAWAAPVAPSSSSYGEIRSMRLVENGSSVAVVGEQEHDGFASLVDATTGALAWARSYGITPIGASASGPGALTGVVETASDDRIVVSGAQERPAASPDLFVAALSLQDGAELWRRSLGAHLHANPAPAQLVASTTGPIVVFAGQARSTFLAPAAVAGPVQTPVQMAVLLDPELGVPLWTWAQARDAASGPYPRDVEFSADSRRLAVSGGIVTEAGSEIGRTYVGSATLPG